MTFARLLGAAGALSVVFYCPVARADIAGISPASWSLTVERYSPEVHNCTFHGYYDGGDRPYSITTDIRLWDAPFTEDELFFSFDPDAPIIHLEWPETQGANWYDFTVYISSPTMPCGYYYRALAVEFKGWPSGGGVGAAAYAPITLDVVPEPSALVLLCLGGCAAIRRLR